MQLLKLLITHTLSVLTKSLWPSLVLTLLASFFYLYCNDPVGAGEGYRAALLGWERKVRASSFFRRLLALFLYTSIVLFSTLLGRGFFADPLANAVSGWRLWTIGSDGSIMPVISSLENVAMLLPFTFLLLWTYGDRLAPSGDVRSIVWRTTKVAFVLSLSIEMLQLVLHLGTWQLSDITYNTLGGSLGGLLWWATTWVSAKLRTPDEDA